MVHSNSATVLRTKINKLSSHEKTRRNLQYYYMKEVHLKGYIRYDSNYIYYSGKGKTMETVKRLVIERGLQEEREGMNRHNIEGF